MSKGYAFGAAGLVAAVGIALLLGHCGGSAGPPAREPLAEGAESAAERQAGSSATPPALAPVPVLVDGTAPAHSANEPAAVDGSAPASTTASAAPPSSAATRINSALARDPKDLALFARIERELQRAPPPAVSTIVELRGKGATREELLTQTRRLLADDFQIRALVVRWIDEVATKVPATPGASPSGPSVVQPIRTK